MTKKQMMALGIGEKLRPKNLWKWDPTAAAMHRCPICSYGREGCPRCFMLPRRKGGDETIPRNFQYDPEKFKRDEKAKLEAQLKEK